MTRPTPSFPGTAAALTLLFACAGPGPEGDTATQDAAATPDSEPAFSTVRFGPCTEFIGALYAAEDSVRALVPDAFELVAEEGAAQVQVRTIRCERIEITYEDGEVVTGEEHIVYQLGSAVVPPVTLDAHAALSEAVSITEYSAYATVHVTDLQPLADALEKAGFTGVHYADDLTFDTGDDDPDACALVPVSGSMSTPSELAFGFSGMVRDLGLEPEDGCSFGPEDETGPERAVWWSGDEGAIAVSDTAVPDTQLLLFNADETYTPLPVDFTPMGSTLRSIVGSEPTTFAFTLSGTLNWGAVSTDLYLVE